MSRAESYDPSAPEGDVSTHGQYMSARQVRGLLIVFAVLFFSFIPIYQIMKGKTDRARCTANMQAMFDALGLYAEQHDDRYPPVDRSETPGSLVPSLGDTGHVYTWASDIAGYMSARASFVCPAANPEEIVQTEDPKSSKNTLPLSYGMYAPYGGYLISLVENPDNTIIIGETSNRGTRDTFDPEPFASATGQALPDGFVICWSDSNDNGDSSTTAVTRLAYPDTRNGTFLKDGPARHGDSIHLLTVSGQRINAKPTESYFQIGKRLNPAWTLPPITQRAR